MDFNSTVDLIIRDLNEAREIIDDLKNYPGVPAIQVELAKSKCKNASDVIALLKTISPEAVPGQPVKPVVQQKPEVAQKVRKVETAGPAEMSEIKEPEKIPASKPVTGKPEEKEVHSSIIADRYNNLSTSLNEQLGVAMEDNGAAGKMINKPVSSLSEAIGVNDKFLFIREIFNGSPESYEQVLSAVESADGFSEAREMILGREGIQKDSDAVKQFLSLVKRKFPSDE